MTIQLDHILVPSRDKNASAKLLAEILGVRWAPAAEAQEKVSGATGRWISGALNEAGWREYSSQRASVYVSDSLTLDFVSPRFFRMTPDAGAEQLPSNHYCFRVGDADFDAIVERIRKAGLKFWSTPGGEPDYTVNTRLGGKGIYFMEPDGHGWEILTVSYARPRK